MEYDPVGASTKFIMLKYFQEGLNSSILAKLKYQDLKLENFNQIVKKTVDAKAKTALQARSSTKKMVQNHSRGNKLANSTISKIQDSAM